MTGPRANMRSGSCSSSADRDAGAAVPQRATRARATRHGPDGEGWVLGTIWRPVRLRSAGSTPEVEPVDQLLVAAGVLALEILEQAPALADHHQQATARMKILVVAAEMLGEVLDPLGQDGDLHFR